MDTYKTHLKKTAKHLYLLLNIFYTNIKSKLYGLMGLLLVVHLLDTLLDTYYTTLMLYRLESQETHGWRSVET